MRSILLAFSLLGLACGGSHRSNPPAGEGEVCTASEQCALDHTCTGCTQDDQRCLPGCGEDADCSVGHCVAVQCLTCPCPGHCQG